MAVPLAVMLSPPSQPNAPNFREISIPTKTKLGVLLNLLDNSRQRKQSHHHFPAYFAGSTQSGLSCPCLHPHTLRHKSTPAPVPSSFGILRLYLWRVRISFGGQRRQGIDSPLWCVGLALPACTHRKRCWWIGRRTGYRSSSRGRIVGHLSTTVGLPVGISYPVSHSGCVLCFVVEV